MSGITKLVDHMQLPKFVRVKQYFPHNELSEDEIKAVFEEIFRTFQKLDGTIKVKDKEELENSIKQANLIISQNLRKYEIAWKESYSKLITLLKNNPVEKAEIPQKPEA